MDRPKVGIGVIVLNPEGKILLGRRRGAHCAGTWAFSGGHLEYGETPAECTVRELREETGLKALKIHRGPWTNDVMELKHYITIFMIVTAFEGEPAVMEPGKCERWEWFEPDRLPEPLFAPVVSLRHLPEWPGILDELSYGLRH